jgi:glycosyltransferase involved in cell wall biosynthesis
MPLFILDRTIRSLIYSFLILKGIFSLYLLHRIILAMMNDLTLVIPAYNEAEALGTFLPELLSFCKEHLCSLIIVDDGSKDKTNEILQQYGNEPFFTSIRHKVNKGYGGAIKTGLGATQTKYAITLDADGQHILSDVILLYNNLIAMDADMVIGRRKRVNESLYRKTGKSIIRFIARALMPIQIHDLNSGMKIYFTETVKRYLDLCPNTMAFSDIITLIFIHQSHLVCEHDIQVETRKTGKSTINTKTAFETVMELFHIILLFNPMRIFLPFTLFFLLSSMIWGLPIVIRGEGISVGTLFLFVTGLLFFILGLLAEQLALIRKSLMMKK